MAKTEDLLRRIGELEQETGVKRTIFAVCPNSTAVIRASYRAAKRNNAPIYFAATLNQIDNDGGYTGMTQSQFTKLLDFEMQRVNYTGCSIVAIDHGGPWLKDKQRVENWSTEDAMQGVKESFEAAVAAGYDLIHVDPTVDINVPKGETIDIRVVAARTVELIAHTEKFRKENGYAPISYEVGTEEVHGGLADDTTFDTFIVELKKGLEAVGLADVWPCFIVGKVGTDLHTTLFDPEVARKLTAKVRPYGSYIKGHYTDGVSNPEEVERRLDAEGKVAVRSEIIAVLTRLVRDSGRWLKWLQDDEQGLAFEELAADRRLWLVQTGCRYIWQHPEALAARAQLFANLGRVGIDAEEVVLSRIERDMDKYFVAFNLVGLNDLL